MSRRALIAAIASISVVGACASDGDGSSSGDVRSTSETAATGGSVGDDAASATSDDPSSSEPSSTEPEPTTTPTSSQPETEVDRDRDEAATLDWSACDGGLSAAGLECATLTVPVDHDDPSGDTIDLAVARAATADPDERIGSLVFNPGGPGGSGIDFLEIAQLTVPDDVASRFDLVSFDPRGVAESAPIECELELDDGIELVADDDRAAWDALLAESQDELATCTAPVPELERRVGTNNTARDLDLLRDALGDEQLTYVGFSYGTRLGATYAELFPDRVRALVLDGAVRPTDDFDALGIEQGRGFDLAFANFADACDADPDCLLAELGPTIEVVEGIRAEIAEVGTFDTDDPDRVLTPGELELGIIASLYSTSSWPFLAQAIYLADTNADGTLFQVLADSYLGRESDGTYANQTEANAFINCADDPSRPPVDEVWAIADETADGSEWFGPALRASTGCVGFDDAVDPLVLGPASGTPPILVIGTTGDPATPYEWSVAMADFLDSGVLYTVEGEGHTAYTSIECVSDVVGAYLVDLVVPDEGSSCVDDAGTDFFVPAGESEVDQTLAFLDCLVEEGAPIEPVTLADLLADPTGEQLFADLDLDDPDFRSAVFACSDLLPG